MNLKSLSVKNFRSITEARKLTFSNRTVLIGPNNEGKSNLLRALNCGMQVLQHVRGILLSTGEFRTTYIPRRAGGYSADVDYPIAMRESETRPETEIIIEFELDRAERKDLRSRIGHAINGTIPIRIRPGTHGYKINIIKQGPASQRLNQKVGMICDYISKRFHFTYMPSVRTARDAQENVNLLIRGLMRNLEVTEEYQAALRAIESLQRPLYEKLGLSLTKTMQTFVPDIVSVQVRAEADRRLRALEASEVLVNDGSMTPLSLKGDGLQSLGVIAIMRYASENKALGKRLIVAIEEPESHLHPEAIHNLKQVLTALSDEHQLIISTHCPSLADRTNVQNNIVVRDGRAIPAKSISEIRDTLGVRLSDNLSFSAVVLVVEGETELKVVSAYLREMFYEFEDLLNRGVLTVREIGGAGNLRHQLRHLASAVTSYVAFLDNDQAANEAVGQTIEEGLLGITDCVRATMPGKHESEFEDLYDLDWMLGVVNNHLGIGIIRQHISGKGKWSSRMRLALKRNGIVANDAILKALKAVLAESASTDLANAFGKESEGVFDTLANRLLVSAFEAGEGG